MKSDMIDKNNLFQYTFYDESHKLNVVLDEDYIKEVFEADIVLLKETEHK